MVLADEPYSPTQWLSEAAMSVVHELTGVAGIHLLRALAVVALLAFLQLTAAVYTTPVRAAGVALPAMAATAAQWGERPQLAGLVLLAVTTWLWSRARRDAAVPWLVIPLTWVWAMLHGSWVIGCATGALFVVAMLLENPRRERAWARLAGVVVASVSVAGLTPLGPSLLLEPLVVGAAARGRVNEWAAPGLTNPLVLVVVLMAPCRPPALGAPPAGQPPGAADRGRGCRPGHHSGPHDRLRCGTRGACPWRPPSLARCRSGSPGNVSRRGRSS